MPEKPTIKPWTKLDTRLVAKARVFDMNVSRMRSPDGSYEDDYYSLDCPDWSNIIALTADKQVVLIEQYRHGIDDISLEIPGGIIDPNEDPEAGTVRELAEETGYTVKKVHSLGWVHPNPAIQANKCHLFYGVGAELTKERNLDIDEDIAVKLVSLDEVLTAIMEERFSHSLMIAAFLKLFCSDFSPIEFRR